MPTFTPFEGHYSNHLGSCIHPIDGTIFMAVTFHPNGTGPFNLQLVATLSPGSIYVAPALALLRTGN